MMSPGWQLSALQILSIAPIGNSFTVPRQMADMVGGRIPVMSASCFWVMPRSAKRTFNRNFIGTCSSPLITL
nr:MAG TPA: hypothetical protein [Caudoviricetes sp.]